MNDKNDLQTPQQTSESYHDYMLKVDLVKCPGCKYESSTENVRLHIKKLHMLGKFCKICNKDFNNLRSAHCAKHMLMAIITQLKEQCNECSQLFMLDCKRSEDEVFKCKECTRNGSETEVNRTPIFPHLCDTCHKRFSHRKTLNEHLRTVHADNELYRCESCPRVFRYRKNLNAHKRIHNEPVTCEICFEDFDNQHLLNRHMIYHAEPSEYVCSTCGILFSTLLSFESHKPCGNEHQEND